VAVPDALLNVIATDGYPVMPAQARSVILGMGERFDATFTVDKSVPVVAVPEGKQGHAQLNIRVGTVPTAVKVDAFVEAVRNEVPLNTAKLSPTPEVTLPARTPDQLIEVRLSGPGGGYTWPFNGRLYDPTKDGIPVRRDQRVRIRMINESMMFHPIHLHGHTFSGGRCQRSAGAQGHRCSCRPSRRWKWTSTPTTRVSGSLTATTHITWKAVWAAGSSTSSSWSITRLLD
jgi:FtsP/CotA-like multicopper oxidase with cupredoxin domain